MPYIRCTNTTCRNSSYTYEVPVELLRDARDIAIPFYRPVSVRCASCGSEAMVMSRDEAKWEEVFHG